MDKKILIVKARSRLGMKYIPHGGSELNIGVENGPDAVLTESFLQKFPDHSLIAFDFSTPEDTTDDNYYAILAKETDDLAQKIAGQYSTDTACILTVGGDHSIASAPLLAVTRLEQGKRVGVIMFDSHGDIHLKQTSPTGNYHGMWLRPFWSRYDDPEIQKTIDAGMEGDQLLFVGNVLLEEEEVNFLSRNTVPIFSSAKFADDVRNDSYAKITDFCMRHDHVHVSFDIDVFKTELVSATGTPNPDGFGKQMILDIIDTVKKTSRVLSLDLVEVNPRKKGAEETVALAQEVIERFLS